MASKLNKVEQQILEEINSISNAEELSEGFLSKLFSVLAAKPLSRKLEKAIKIANKDPKVAAALSDFQNQRKYTLDLMSHYCEKNPDSPLCYGKFANTYGFDFDSRRKKGERSRFKHKGRHIRK